MKMELTKEQSQKGDDLLRKLISEGGLSRKTVYAFFDDRDLAVSVCKILEKKGIINLSRPTINDEFMEIFPKDGISTFLKNGGLIKEYSIIVENYKRQTLELRKSEIDLKLAEKMLKEYPKTKWFARIGFFIGVILAVLQLIKWVLQP